MTVSPSIFCDPPVARSTFAMVATRTGALAVPPARTSPLTDTSLEAVRDRSDTPRVPPAVIGPEASILSDTSETFPAALEIKPASSSALSAESETLPTVSTELLMESVPVASIAIGRCEEGTASTVRSSASLIRIAYGSAGKLGVEDAIMRSVSSFVRTSTSPPASLASVMPTVVPMIRPV